MDTSTEMSCWLPWRAEKGVPTPNNNHCADEALQQLLESGQPFFVSFHTILVSIRLLCSKHSMADQAEVRPAYYVWHRNT